MKSLFFLLLFALMCPVLAWIPIGVNDTISTDNITYSFAEGYNLTTKLQTNSPEVNSSTLDINHTYIFAVTSEKRCNISIINLSAAEIEFNTSCPATTLWINYQIGNFSGNKSFYVDSVLNSTLAPAGNLITLNYTSPSSQNIIIEDYATPEEDGTPTDGGSSTPTLKKEATLPNIETITTEASQNYQYGWYVLAAMVIIFALWYVLKNRK